ncbi:hypothetical protein pb186bvf_016407 [Paramecium bursaria]
MQYQQPYENPNYQQPPLGYPLQQGPYSPVPGQQYNQQYPYAQGQPINPQQMYPGLADPNMHLQPQGIVVIEVNQPFRRNAKGLEFPATIQCPKCNQEIRTNLVYKLGDNGWLMVILLAIVFFPLMCLPCCLDDCKDRVHYCPKCGKKVGKRKYKPSFQKCHSYHSLLIYKKYVSKLKKFIKNQQKFLN